MNLQQNRPRLCRRLHYKPRRQCQRISACLAILSVTVVVVVVVVVAAAVVAVADVVDLSVSGCPLCSLLKLNNKYSTLHKNIFGSLLLAGGRSVVVSALAPINIVNRHWARLLLGRVTAHGQVNRLGLQPAV